jgi:beta-galactosidase
LSALIVYSIFMMGSFSPVVAADAPGASIPAQAATSMTSYERRINTEWKFMRVDGNEPSSPESPTFDDTGWETVTLPHTPHIEKYDETHPWQGICWYRKTIKPDVAWAGKRVGIQFGAAMQIADVYVNGVHRTRHLGGYLPFTIDLTGDIKASGATPIVIAVRLDNRDTDQVAPGKPTSDLDFNYPGGLYRSVKLIVTEPVHITDPIAANIVAGGGIFVTYSDVSDQSATVHVKTDVANDGDGLDHNVTVVQTLIDSSGTALLSTVSNPILLSSGDNHEVLQSFVVDSPKLWSPDHPNLYTLRTTVQVAGIGADMEDTTIGIRSFVLDNRVRINGEEFHIAGTNRHQEYPYIEYALSPNAGRRDAQRIKDGGFNHIRLSHYPQDPAFLDACDKLGILVQAPVPGWQIFPENPSFVTSTYDNIRQLVRRDRNHPSIIFWEPNLNETNPPADWSRTAWEITHEEYPGPECYTFGDGSTGHWTPGWDVKHFIREYGDFGFGGNESTSRQTRGEGEKAQLQEAWNFLWCHNADWANFADTKSNFFGDATWCMFDYNRGYYSKQEHSGMMDIFRLPKYVYYFFQSQRDPALLRPDVQSGPMVFVASDWTPRPSPSKVIVFSNCNEVELSVNGKVLARQKPDSGPDSKYSNVQADLHATVGHNYDTTGGDTFDGGNSSHLDHPIFTFLNVPYSPGVLKATGIIGGKQAAVDSVRTPDIPKALTLEFDTQGVALAADGADAVFLRVNIVDKNGTVVPVNALPSLKVSVTGPGRLIGTDPIHVEAGVASLLLQSDSTTPGTVTVTASADGLGFATASFLPVAHSEYISRTPAPRAPKMATAVHSVFVKLTGKPVGTPGSYANDGADITKAFDGDITTFVDAPADMGGDNCWVGLDLGSPKMITKIRWYPRDEWADRMTDGIFQGSNSADFAHPVDLYTLPDKIPDKQWGETTDIESSQPFRYVRFASPPGGSNNVAELEFFTSPA